MKKTLSKALSLILAVILAFGATIPAFASDEIPDGYTPIYTAEDLNNIRNNLSGSYILMNDIDLSAYENWEPIGNNSKAFAGSFDGNGYTIKGLKINIEASENEKVYCGLFGRLYGGTLKNISIYDADVFAKSPENNSATIYAGILLGWNCSESVTSCAVSGKIRTENFSTTYTGGVIGFVDFGAEVENCTNYADVSAVTIPYPWQVSVGGVLGNSEATDRCLANYGNVSLSAEKVTDNEYVLFDVGGVIGNNNYSFGLHDSFNCGKVSVDFSGDYIAVGGLTGTSSNIYRSYNCGTVTVPDDFSGCAGALCGNVISSDGLGSNPYVENLYYLLTDMVPAYSSYRHPDTLDEDSYDYCFRNVQELGEKKMKSQSCFAGFDFDTVWVMEEGGYPVLQNQPTLYGKESIELEKGEIYSAEIVSDWVSSDETVAFVNENGEIEAIGAGTAIITVNLAYNYYIKYTVTVTEQIVIPEPEPEPEPTPEPQTRCPFIWLVRIIKNILNFVVGFAKNLFV